MPKVGKVEPRQVWRSQVRGIGGQPTWHLRVDAVAGDEVTCTVLETGKIVRVSMDRLRPDGQVGYVFVRYDN